MHRPVKRQGNCFPRDDPVNFQRIDCCRDIILCLFIVPNKTAVVDGDTNNGDTADKHLPAIPTISAILFVFGFFARCLLVFLFILFLLFPISDAFGVAREHHIHAVNFNTAAFDAPAQQRPQTDAHFNLVGVRQNNFVVAYGNVGGTDAQEREARPRKVAADGNIKPGGVFNRGAYFPAVIVKVELRDKNK